MRADITISERLRRDIERGSDHGAVLLSSRRADMGAEIQRLSYQAAYAYGEKPLRRERKLGGIFVGEIEMSIVQFYEEGKRAQIQFPFNITDGRAFVKKFTKEEQAKIAVQLSRWE